MHKQKLLDYVGELSKQLNIQHPEDLSRKLLILIEGAITTSYVMGDPDAADNAREIAQMLLKQVSP
ncbi:hypothetical protein EM595_p1117 (plasmid) [Duffyella gerundensis]|nr:hypothetical protein EM595_p1117 [Duffyella gerundensis]